MKNLNIIYINGGLGTVKVCTIVHAGVFHGDDVTAVALLSGLYHGEASHYIVRVPHQADIDEVKEEVKVRLGEATKIIVADIGRNYNPENLEFDHHQYGKGDKEFGHAAAGLVYKFLIDEKYINEFEEKELYKFIEMVDENDLGIYNGPWEGTIPWSVSLMNRADVYGPGQDAAFVNAVQMVYKIINDARRRAKAKEETFKKLKEGKILDEKTLLLPEYLPGWNDVIFYVPEYDNVDVVIWKDEKEGTFKAQVVPDEPGSFGRRGRKIPHTEAGDDIVFIHKGEFFGVFKTLEAALEHIES